MKNKKKVVIAGLILLGMFLGAFEKGVEGAPPIQSEEEALKEEKSENKEEEKTKEELTREKEEKALKKTLGQMRRRLQKGEKKLRVRANIFRSNVKVSDCTGADKARSRLSDIGDEGGLVIKGRLSIEASNEANIEKNEGSVNNQTSVNITNEYYKRC